LRRNGATPAREKSASPRRTTIQALRDGLRAYNQYRGEESVAKAVAMDEDTACIDFRGPFCHTCGVYDYFEDLIYELQARGVTTSIRGWTELDEETYRVRFDVTR
jgi:hypothetical protein